MLRFVFGFFGAIFSAVTLGLFAVALSIGAVLWMYGRDLPDTEALAQYAPPTISRVYSGEGALMDEFARERRVFAPADEIPDLVKQAFISAEDKNFYVHKGYDPRGMAAAALDAATGGPLRGASTITQQVMKNFLLGGGIRVLVGPEAVVVELAHPGHRPGIAGLGAILENLARVLVVAGLREHVARGAEHHVGLAPVGAVQHGLPGHLVGVQGAAGIDLRFVGQRGAGQKGTENQGYGTHGASRVRAMIAGAGASVIPCA